MRPASLLLALLVLLSPLWASQASAESRPQYQIELLLFQRGGNAGGEHQRHDKPAPSSGRAIATLSAPQGNPRPAGGGVVILSSDQLSLRAEAEALRRKGLTPVLHTAWRQPVGERRNGDWLWLNAGAVRGLIRISLGRYLHIDSDLVYQGARGTLQGTDHLRLRSRELHYIDHPAFGMLVIITPV